MTNPVILLGTQSNGETLPVQVDATGRLVAEGLQGQVGPEGPPGGAFPLPPDPYEGALLGWLNGGLAWIGTPPIPVPPGRFGPIQAWDGSSVLTVDGEIPESVGTGVYVYQCNEDGTFYTAGWNVSSVWSANYQLINGPIGAPDQLAPYGFNGSTDISDGYVYAPTSGAQIITFNTPIEWTNKLEIWTWQASNGLFEINGVNMQPTIDNKGVGFPGGWVDLTNEIQGSMINSIHVTRGTAGTSSGFAAIRADSEILVDTDKSLGMRVNSVAGDMVVGVPTSDVDFTVGKFLIVPSQRVAPWVLYGNDPTSLIDHLRQISD